MKVRCIDNEGWAKCLTLNKEYVIIKTYNPCYYITDNIGREFGYSKDRFKIVEEGDAMDLTIEQKVEDLENQIKEFKEQLHKQEETTEGKKIWWTPKDGEQYYFIDMEGQVNPAFWNNSDWQHNERFKLGNVFQNIKIAEREVFERQLRFKLKKFAYENNEEEIDWNNNNQEKYYIVNDYYRNELDSRKVSRTRICNQIYFISLEIVEKAIEIFKDDLIRYFTANK